ncbi:hypothetical protein TWF694_003619 [Orbilia ellipsospora]|uniref:Terpene synthase n=1 Tax=Orbilia ellipsospora TaxID=2528407 RepID=A0AAV9X0Z0_9PEZI
MIDITTNAATARPGKPSYIPSLIPYEGSIPILPEFLEPHEFVSHFCDGYFLKAEPRIIADKSIEISKVEKLEQDWLDRGGCRNRGTTISDAGGMLSLTFPEADTKRLAAVSALNAFAFIQDDIYDGDYLAHLEGEEKEAIAKKYRLIELQMKGKLYMDALDGDEDLIALVEKLEKWAGGAINNLQAESDIKTVDEYLDRRIDDIGAEPFIAICFYVQNLKLTDHQLGKLQTISRLTVYIATLTNDYFSVEREWIAHATAGRQGVPDRSSIWILVEQGFSIGEARRIVKERIVTLEEEFLRLRDKLVAENQADKEIFSKYISYLQYNYAGYLVASLSWRRYLVDPKTRFCPQQDHKLEDLPRREGFRKVNMNGYRQRLSMNGTGNGATTMDLISNLNTSRNNGLSNAWYRPPSSMCEPLIMITILRNIDFSF